MTFDVKRLSQLRYCGRLDVRGSSRRKEDQAADQLIRPGPGSQATAARHGAAWQQWCLPQVGGSGPPPLRQRLRSAPERSHPSTLAGRPDARPRAELGAGSQPCPVKATIDAMGRVVLPKPLGDSLGLRSGSKVNTSRYEDGLTLVPVGGAARLVDEAVVRGLTGEPKIDDQTVLG
jgi:AbrB family looped-hinge helix DNA binding protein